LKTFFIDFHLRDIEHPLPPMAEEIPIFHEVQEILCCKGGRGREVLEEEYKGS